MDKTIKINAASDTLPAGNNFLTVEDWKEMGKRATKFIDGEYKRLAEDKASK